MRPGRRSPARRRADPGEGPGRVHRGHPHDVGHGGDGRLGAVVRQPPWCGRLRGAGAIIVGKTNLPEIGHPPRHRARPLRPGAQPVGHDAHARRLVRRQRRRGGLGHGVVRAWQRRRRLDPHPCLLLRARGAEADPRAAFAGRPSSPRLVGLRDRGRASRATCTAPPSASTSSPGTSRATPTGRLHPRPRSWTPSGGSRARFGSRSPPPRRTAFPSTGLRGGRTRDGRAARVDGPPGAGGGRSRRTRATSRTS